MASCLRFLVLKKKKGIPAKEDQNVTLSVMLNQNDVGASHNNRGAGAASIENAAAASDRNEARARPVEIFTYSELKKAANNFSENYMIEKAGFVRVYKGKLVTGQIVAVKMLNITYPLGIKRFQSEIMMHSLLRHPNIVNMIGFSAERDEKLVVFESTPLGSLDKHLHDPKPPLEPLDWETRMTIALGTARGLNYLHNVKYFPILFGGFSPANILLDERFHPKITGFGVGFCDQTFLFAIVYGTVGYMPPEYYDNIKSDSINFGPILVGLITGRRPLELVREQNYPRLYDWLRPKTLDHGELYKVVDPVLGEQYHKGTLCSIAELALACLNPNPDIRPTMEEVLQEMTHMAIDS